jgi:elongation factor G
VSKLLLLYASDSQEVDELPFGSVGVILGLKYTRTGDTLVSLGGETNQRPAPRDITPPSAVISASVVPLSNSDLEPVQGALECLVRTDPSVRVDSQEGQILVHGLGALHLEVVEGRLRDEWNVKFEFGQRRVSYREGLGSGVPQIGWNVWQSDVGGKHTSVVVPLKVRPMQVEEKGDPTWDGSVVIDHQGNPLPAPEASSDTLLACVVDGLANALSNSPHSSLAMSRIHIQINPSDILQSIPPSLITGATATVLRKRVRDAGPGPLMEPYVFLKISVNESSLGKVIKDLIEHGGQVLDLGEGSAFGVDDSEEAAGFPTDNLYIPPQWLSPSGVNSFDASPSGGRLKCSVNAIAPLSRFFNYSNRLRAMSEGYGTFEMVNAGFKEVSDARRMDILREIGRA